MLALLSIIVCSGSSYSRSPQNIVVYNSKGYYLRVSAGQESEHSLTESSAPGCPTGRNRGISWAAVSSEGSNGTGAGLLPAHCLLVGWSASVPRWLLAGGFVRCSPHEPLCRAPHNLAVGLPQSEHERKPERQGKRGAIPFIIFYNIILEVAPHYFVIFYSLERSH